MSQFVKMSKKIVTNANWCRTSEKNNMLYTGWRWRHSGYSLSFCNGGTLCFAAWRSKLTYIHSCKLLFVIELNTIVEMCVVCRGIRILRCSPLLTQFLLALRIPPTWRCGFTLSSLTSIHRMHSILVRLVICEVATIRTIFDIFRQFCRLLYRHYLLI